MRYAIKCAILTFLLFAVLLSCQEDEQNKVTPGTDSLVVANLDLKGYVQKGPFINGTSITVSELSQMLTATGKNFNTQIIDNKGAFSLKGVSLKSAYVQLKADGFYFDEVKGEKSAAQLTLYALADVSDISSVNVNLLSHLEKDRVTYLIQEKEQTFAAAKQQAQQEILAIFGIIKADMAHSEALDISQDGEDNAILLAISAILQANNTVAELSELLANIITDIREDGKLESESTQKKIRAHAMLLALANIRQHLEARYEELGVDATIPNFEQYVDSDGDGFLNKDEDDTPDDFAFEARVDVAIDTEVVSNEIVVSGLKEGGKTNISADGGLLFINGQGIVDSFAQVGNGDKVKVVAQSSHRYGTETSIHLKIGLTDRTFRVKTKASLYQKKANFPLSELIVAGFAADEMFYVLTASNDFYMYNPASNTWHQKAVFKGEKRMKATSFAINGKGYIGLGHTVEGSDSGREEYLKDFWRYDPENDNWFEITNFEGESRIGAYSYILNNKAYIGLGSWGGTFFTDTWELDPASETWTRKSDFPAKGRNDAVTLTNDNDGKGFVGLGRVFETNSASDFWEYNPQNDSWYKKTAYPTKDESTGIGLAVGNRGYIITAGGYGKGSLFYIYNFEDDSWKSIEGIDTYIHTNSVVVSIYAKGYYLNPESGELHEFIPPQD